MASSPGAGAVIDEPPPELRLVFSEPLEAQATSLDIVDESGTALLERGGGIDPSDPFALIVTDPDLADGVYTIRWRTLSAADGHTAEGFFSFVIGDGAALPTAPQPDYADTHQAADAPGVIGRWLTYLGLLLGFGVAVFQRVVLRAVMPRALVRALAAGFGVAAAGTLAVAVAAGLEAGSVGDYLLGTRNGVLHLLRAGAAGIGAIAILVVPARAAVSVAAVAGLVGIVLLGMAGHAAALPGVSPVAGAIVHILGAAVWISGIAMLVALVLRPALVLGDRPRPQMREVVPRFSALALTSIGLVALTGVHAAWVLTGTMLNPATNYGMTLLMKSGFAIGALALGGLNYLDGGRGMRWIDTFRNRVSVEAMSAATVLVMAAALATTPPVDEVGGVPVAPVPDAFGAVAPGMSMEVVPGRPGLNRIVVTTTDALAAMPALELSLDRLDAGTSTLVPLVLEGSAGTGGGAHGAHAPAASAGSVDWFADALVLPAGSEWDTSVRIRSASGKELSRQRFAFSLSDDGIEAGRINPLITPASVIAVLLMIGGALGVGLGIGGGRLPRTDARASRAALLAGGAVAVGLGGLMVAERLLAL